MWHSKPEALTRRQFAIMSRSYVSKSKLCKLMYIWVMDGYGWLWYAMVISPLLLLEIMIFAIVIFVVNGGMIICRSMRKFQPTFDRWLMTHEFAKFWWIKLKQNNNFHSIPSLHDGSCPYLSSVQRPFVISLYLVGHRKSHNGLWSKEI